MPRPKKNNADYFSHDATMRNDRKILALRSRYGLKGYAVYGMMLEALTESDGFEMVIDKFELELLAGDFGIESTELGQIMEYMVELRLLVKESFCDRNEYKYFSEGLKKRLQPVITKRLKGQEAFRNNQKQDENDVSETETGVSATEIAQPVTETPQSKRNRIKKNNNPIASTKHDEEDLRLAGLLRDRIRDHLPKAKEPNLENWAGVIEKMRRIDKRSPTEIEHLIEWCQKDKFWRAVILSANKFRDKFDTLTAQSQRDADPSPGTSRQQTGRLHDGTKVKKINGEWRDYDNPFGSKLRTDYYPEITNDTVMSEETWQHKQNNKNL